MTTLGGDILTSIDILRRRLKVFEYWSGRNLGPGAISDLLKKQGIKGSSLKTVRRDLESMDKWLPEVVRLLGDGMIAAAEIIGSLRIIRQRLINLGDTADNSAAQVGALKAATDSAAKEIELRLKTGQIRSVPQKLEITGDVSEDQLSKYIPVIADMVMEEQTRRTNEGDASQDPSEPMDPSKANP